MVHIAPFRGVRFNLNRVKRLGDVICPPYDVIQIPDYHRLLKSNPKNIVRIELPQVKKQDDRYATAGTLWAQWQKQRQLVQDKTPAFYGYEQRFLVNNQPTFRRGFFAAMQLETPGKGAIRPHERTFPKHKEDRLKLMRATFANISPIFGLYFDRAGTSKDLIKTRVKEKPLMTARDDKGVTHRLWKWDDVEAVKTLQKVLRPEDVFIADGHHRYETAWNFSKEAARKGKDAAASARYVMIFLCPLDDPGLVIHPTHRCVNSDFSVEEWKRRLSADWTIERLTSFQQMANKLRHDADWIRMGMIGPGSTLSWLSPKKISAARKTMPVIELHKTILNDVPHEAISFMQDPRDAMEAVQRGECQVAFLLPPPKKEIFAASCAKGQLMPQKSTYFFPKVVTGMVMRSLNGDL